MPIFELLLSELVLAFFSPTHRLKEGRYSLLVIADFRPSFLQVELLQLIPHDFWNLLLPGSLDVNDFILDAIKNLQFFILWY